MHYDDKGRLTRAGMEAKIASGASVIHNGQVHTSIATLPSPAALAQATGDKTDIDRVRAENEAMIARLQEENRQLKASPPPSTIKLLIVDDLAGLGLDEETGNALLTAQAATTTPLTDQQIDDVPNIGPATVAKIREAQAKR